MTGVMYQGYASYFQAYNQRHGSSPAFPFNPYDKKYRFTDVSGTASPSGVPPLAQSASQDYNSSNQSSSGASAVPPEETIPASTIPTTSPTVGGNISSTPPSVGNQQLTQNATDEHQTKSEEKSEDYADAQYLSANCVVLTYFSGDLASAIDEHFSRALNQNYSKGGKDPCPMSQRNLPASFWNSQQQPAYTTTTTAGGLSHESLYSDYSSFHGLPQPDPWAAYNLTAVQQYSHHRAVSDFTYMPSSSRYSHNYSSLFMGRPRIPQCMMAKGDPWTPSARLHEDVALDPSTYAHHFPSMTGLEAAAAGSSHQDYSKDLYWI